MLYTNDKIKCKINNVDNQWIIQVNNPLPMPALVEIIQVNNPTLLMVWLKYQSDVRICITAFLKAI